VNGDVVAVAKKLKDASKLYPALVIKGGYMDGAPLDAAGASALADLESREVMLSKIAGMLKSEMSRAAATFIATQSKFLSLLEAYKEKLPAGEEPAAEAPAEPEAAAEPEAEAASEPEATAEPQAEVSDASTDEAPAAEAEENEATTEEE
jgi:large subunit ribosomal protein L10